MKKLVFCGLSLLLVLAASASGGPGHKGKSWSISADYIEACSCNMFCQCYFKLSPEGGEMCDFNNAVKIKEGHVGDTVVSGKKVWLSGDLGGDFSKGEMKQAVITFEPGTTRAEKDAIEFLVGKIYPVKWSNFAEDEAPITWERNGSKGHASLGDSGDVVLEGLKDSAGKPTVINNLTYWGAQKNGGFYLATSTHHYKGHGLDYTYKGKNGFFIHIESSGTD